MTKELVDDLRDRMIAAGMLWVPKDRDFWELTADDVSGMLVAALTVAANTGIHKPAACTICAADVLLTLWKEATR
jgi:hypothetical protein